jgi:hypothetical protein
VEALDRRPRCQVTRHEIEHTCRDACLHGFPVDESLKSRRLDLLDEPKIVNQFVGLERRTGRGGRDTIDHAPGSHDDLANAVAGVVFAHPTSRTPLPPGRASTKLV